MLALLTIAAATTVMAPPQLPKSSTPDLRISAGGEARSGAVIFTLFTDPKGKAFRCEVEKVIDADYSQLVCDEYLKARFTVATGPDGKPSYGQYRSIMNFTAGGKSAGLMVLTPEMMLNVKPIPGLLTQRRDIRLIVQIDGKGKVAHCAAAAATDNAQLVRTACGQAQAEWTGTQLDVSGSGLTSYVRELTVAFVPEGR